MRDDQQVAKYVNTPDGPLYHKRGVLFGLHLARAAAARAGRMILVEGYTDALALHQAGVAHAVGIMGTAFTEEQLAELRRVVTTLELCLDADSAGQQAVLRAAHLAAGRGVELRVVVLPEGADPADLLLAEGAEALRERVAASVPFVAFEVDRILARTDTGSAEGRDRALSELAEAMAGLGPSVLRDQLLRRASGALELSEARLQTLLAGPRPGHADANGADRAGGDLGGVVGAGPQKERLLLALCIAVPDAGEATLGGQWVERSLTSESMRRAARHLRGRCRTPLTDLPPDDEPFARVMAGLVELAGRVPTPSPDRLEHARLLLEVERLDRAILRARAAGEGTSELARERETIREALHGVVSRLEATL
jgi:DNA primase